MKKFLLTFLTFFGMMLFALSQTKPGKAVISTPGVHCEYCKERIENYLTHQYGISAVKVDLKKKTTTVTWITDRTNIEEIKAHIANKGYDADDVEAEITSYNRLPKPCRVKPEVAPVLVDSAGTKN